MGRLPRPPPGAQDIREALAELVTAAGPDAEEDEDALLAILGQALGLTLCLGSLNPVAMLGLLTARLDAPGVELSAPMPDSHWDAVLVRSRRVFAASPAGGSSRRQPAGLGRHAAGVSSAVDEGWSATSWHLLQQCALWLSWPAACRKRCRQRGSR